MAININLPSVTQSYTNLASFPATGSTSILYKALNNNKLYTWDGSKYNEIDKRFASSWGSVSAAAPTTAITKDEVGLGNVDNTADLDKPVSTATQTALNAKQDTLVSATNIKTINGSSVLGSGDLTISGGSGLQGVHALLPVTTGSIVPIVVNGNGITTVATITNRLYAIPFIPSRTFTTSNLYLNVTVLGSGVNGRILIYSDLNGKPNTKIFESSNLDCSTTGIKTATTSQTFTAGVTYYICTQFSGICTANAYANTALMNIYGSGTGISSSYFISPAFGSAPSPFGTPSVAGANIPAVFITVA